MLVFLGLLLIGYAPIGLADLFSPVPGIIMSLSGLIWLGLLVISRLSAD